LLVATLDRRADRHTQLFACAAVQVLGAAQIVTRRSPP
jgi:hypothetical protein